MLTINTHVFFFIWRIFNCVYLWEEFVLLFVACLKADNFVFITLFVIASFYIFGKRSTSSLTYELIFEELSCSFKKKINRTKNFGEMSRDTKEFCQTATFKKRQFVQNVTWRRSLKKFNHDLHFQWNLLAFNPSI